MRLTIISTMEGFPWGGSEELWFRVAKAAINEGAKVQVCVKNWQCEPAKMGVLRSMGATVLKRKFSKYAWLLMKLTHGRVDPNFSYLNLIAKFQPDVILISNGGTTEFFECRPLYEFVLSANKPFLLISQYYHEAGRSIDSDVMRRIKKIRRPWRQFYFVAKRNLSTLERKLAHTLPNVSIINNPVNIERPSIAPWPSAGFLKMACIARYDCAFKGQDILLQTLAESEFNAFEYTLAFYGSGPDMAYLRELVHYYNLSGRVTIRDQVADIDKVWEESHLLVLPSIGEGTPLVLQECMLKGRPALVTDVGGNSQLIRDGITGFLANAPSLFCLKEKLLDVFRTPNESLKMMGERAFNDASDLIDLHPEARILDTIRSASQN